MTRTIGSAMTVVAAIMVTGCTMDDPSSARESGAASRQQQASEPVFSPRGSATVLIFGDLTGAINTLEDRLTGLGHSVTIPDDFRLPTSITELSQYQTIWHLSRMTPLLPAEQNLLREYLSIGGALHLTGEAGSVSGVMNISLQGFLRSVVENGSTITLNSPLQVNPAPPSNRYNVNENAVGGVANSPNTVRSVELLGASGMSGVNISSPNALIYAGNTTVAAIWDSSSLVGDAGKLSIILDSDWLTRLNQSTNDNAKLLQNLQDHMTGSPFINQPPLAVATVPAGQNLDCVDENGVPREFVPVNLDGTASADPDNAPQPLTYTWFEFGEVVGSGPTPTVNLTAGLHVITLLVSDGDEDSYATVEVGITCTPSCTPGDGLFNRCHPGCQCNHGEGDCDTDADCLPGLVCLHDPGAAFGYEDDEVDVCSNVCPTLGIGAWNYCSPQCPCDIGEGDCEDDIDCLPGLRCVSDIGPSFGFQREVDVCEPI